MCDPARRRNRNQRKGHHHWPRRWHRPGDGAPNRNDRIGRFQQQTRPIFDRAAILINPLIGDVLEKGVKQITVGPVQLYTVKAGSFRIFRTLSKSCDNSGNLRRIQGAPRDVIPLGSQQTDVAFGGDGAGRHRQSPIQKTWIGKAAHLHSFGDFLEPTASHLK